MDKINEAWKNASEEMYKAQAEADPKKSTEGSSKQKKGSEKSKKPDDDVQDVDFEEVKD